jgi:nicotinamide-nucleotide amidase
MIIELISIGDELLIGQVVNTNAAWMAEELNRNGFRVHQMTVVADTREHILKGLEEAGNRADLVLVTGGLGPTKDDITKLTLCEFFRTKLIFNEDAFRDIETLFARRGYAVTELNRKQAELPEACISLPNRMGTARGMWLEKERGTKEKEKESGIPHPASGTFIFLPGVPFELKDMFTREALPRLRERFTPGTVYHKTILTQGIGESFLAEILREWENRLPANIRLAYLPQPGIVRLRLTATGSHDDHPEEMVSAEAEKLRQLIPDLIFGYDDDTLEGVTGQLLKEMGKTLSVAESCTGGYLSHLITSVPGSSEYFKGSVVAYDNRVKEKFLHVTTEALEQHGAVSEQVVKEMALGIRKKFHTDYAVATSGIAGPSGGTPEKPVGTVWIAVASPTGILANHYLFGDNRERNIRRTALQALNLLRNLIRSFTP